VKGCAQIKSAVIPTVPLWVAFSLHFTDFWWQH